MTPTAWYDVVYHALKDLLCNRYPIRVSIRADSLDKPTVVVRIANKTESLNVAVHKVRVHYGNWDFSRSFVLYPQISVRIPPKEREEWVLPYEPFKFVVAERTRQKSPPIDTGRKTKPGIDSPAQLFNAIGMGHPRDSWIEVDFNEYENRIFLRGKVKRIFDLVGKQHQERRKQAKEQ